MKAKRDFVKGFYQLYPDGNKYVVAHRSSLTGNPSGFDGMNIDVEVCKGDWKTVKAYMKKVKRVLWINRNDYISPKDIEKHLGVFWVNDPLMAGRR